MAWESECWMIYIFMYVYIYILRTNRLWSDCSLWRERRVSIVRYNWHWQWCHRSRWPVWFASWKTFFVPYQITSQGTHESYLDAADSFLVVEEEPSKLDGSYIVEDSSRGIILRAGAIVVWASRSFSKKSYCIFGHPCFKCKCWHNMDLLTLVLSW